MYRLDFISGVFWFIFSIFAAYESFRLGLGSFNRPGSGLLPFMMASVLGFLSLLICLQFLIHREETGGKDLWSNPRGLPNMVIVLLLIFGYIFVLEKLGYLITTFFFLLLLLKGIEPQPWRKTVVFSCLGSFISYLLFKVWLKVPLPSGFLNQFGV